MFTYLFFLTPELITRTLPISILVAVLVAFGGAQQAERGDGVKALRREPSPASPAGVHRERAVLRGGCSCSTTTMCPGRTEGRTRCATKSRAAPRRPICARTASGSWATGRAFTTTGTSITTEKVIGGGKRVRSWNRTPFPPRAADFGGARSLEPDPEDLGVRKRLELADTGASPARRIARFLRRPRHFPS